MLSWITSLLFCPFKDSFFLGFSVFLTLVIWSHDDKNDNDTNDSGLLDVYSSVHLEIKKILGMLYL